MPHRPHPPPRAARSARPPRSRDGTTPKSRRGATQILLVCFFVLLVAGTWGYGAYSVIEDHELRAHGLRETGTVVQVSGHGQDTTYLVSFEYAGATRSVWTSDIRAGTRRNDTVELLVDPGNPARVADARVTVGDWFVPVFLLPVGLVVLWLAWQMWRSDRWTFWDLLYARYGRVPPR